MEIKTTEQICDNTDKESKYWIAVDDILKEIKIIDKWHSTHRTLALIKILEDVGEQK
jgi:hypothetical protein